MGIIRDVKELHPSFRYKVMDFLAACDKVRLPLVITETRRTREVMEAYYARGRTLLWAVNTKYVAANLRPITEEENKATITNCLPGESWHYFGLAFDFVPLVNGTADWQYNPADPADHWDEISGIAKELGLTWGGDFRTFQDRPHVEWHPGWASGGKDGTRPALSWSKDNNRLDIPLKGFYGDPSFQFPRAD